MSELSMECAYSRDEWGIYRPSLGGSVSGVVVAVAVAVVKSARFRVR